MIQRAKKANPAARQIERLKRENADLRQAVNKNADIAAAAQHDLAEYILSHRGEIPLERAAAGVRPLLEPFLAAVRKLVIAARTSGGTAGPDEGLCDALDAVEALLPSCTPPARFSESEKPK